MDKPNTYGIDIAGSIDPSSMPSNTSFTQSDDPVKLFLCWVRQSCDDCISIKDGVDCSWCPFSSTCVPNPSTKYPLLAPIDYPDICPLGSKERWELRARGLGCNVSTRNFLSVVVAVVSTLVLVGLIALILNLLSKMVRWCRGRSRTQRMQRGPLGVIFFRGWKNDDAAFNRNARHQRVEQGIFDEAVIDETSRLLRRNGQDV